MFTGFCSLAIRQVPLVEQDDNTNPEASNVTPAYFLFLFAFVDYCFVAVVVVRVHIAST